MSSLPDPATHAYRKDLADAALAGRVIASHYAEPLLRQISGDGIAFAAPSPDSEQIGMVKSGDLLRMLDCSLGWAWGYLPNGRVAYLPSGVVRI